MSLVAIRLPISETIQDKHTHIYCTHRQEYCYTRLDVAQSRTGPSIMNELQCYFFVCEIEIDSSLVKLHCQLLSHKTV